MNEINPNYKDLRHLPIEHSWSIPSQEDLARKFADEFEKFLNQIENSWIKTEDTSDYVVGLLEALIDAMKHGNNWDPEKMVKVDIIFDETQLIISVTDSNPVEFSNQEARQKIIEATLPENLERGSGRGLLMINNYFPDGLSFKFLNPGNKLTMTKLNK